MLRSSQIVRWLAILALAFGLTGSTSAQTNAAPGAPAKSPGPQAKSPAPKAAAPQAKAPAPKAPAVKAKAPAPKPKAAKAPKKTAKAPAKAAAAEEHPDSESVGAASHRRDPFRALVSLTQTGPTIPANLPPGKAGLMISTLRVDGIVRAPNGMLVVVTSPQQRTYFLRQGDRVYDGHVEQISMDGVSFKETGKDPFGKPIERVVTKRIYPSAGEQ